MFELLNDTQAKDRIPNLTNKPTMLIIMLITICDKNYSDASLY
jgi:hypothetical protein